MGSGRAVLSTARKRAIVVLCSVLTVVLIFLIWTSSQTVYSAVNRSGDNDIQAKGKDKAVSGYFSFSPKGQLRKDDRANNLDTAQTEENGDSGDESDGNSSNNDDSKTKDSQNGDKNKQSTVQGDTSGHDTSQEDKDVENKDQSIGEAGEKEEGKEAKQKAEAVSKDEPELEDESLTASEKQEVDEMDEEKEDDETVAEIFNAGMKRVLDEAEALDEGHFGENEEDEADEIEKLSNDVERWGYNMGVGVPKSSMWDSSSSKNKKTTKAWGKSVASKKKSSHVRARGSSGGGWKNSWNKQKWKLSWNKAHSGKKGKKKKWGGGSNWKTTWKPKKSGKKRKVRAHISWGKNWGSLKRKRRKTGAPKSLFSRSVFSGPTWKKKKKFGYRGFDKALKKKKSRFSTKRGKHSKIGMGRAKSSFQRAKKQGKQMPRKNRQNKRWGEFMWRRDWKKKGGVRRGKMKMKGYKIPKKGPRGRGQGSKYNAKNHFRSIMHNNKRLPYYCTCRIVRSSFFGACYFYTDLRARVCASRKCAPTYGCVGRKVKTGVTCIRRKKTKRIIHSGWNRCKTVDINEYFYVPYRFS